MLNKNLILSENHNYRNEECITGESDNFYFNKL